MSDFRKSEAVVRLQECRLDDFELSQTQMGSVFTAIQESEDMKLKILLLRNTDYSKVPPKNLASALVKLEDTNILQARLSPNQVECLFNKMGNSVIMNLPGWTLQTSPPWCLLRLLSELRGFCLHTMSSLTRKSEPSSARLQVWTI